MAALLLMVGRTVLGEPPKVTRKYLCSAHRGRFALPPSESRFHKAHAEACGYKAHAEACGYKAHAEACGYKAHAEACGDQAQRMQLKQTFVSPMIPLVLKHQLLHPQINEVLGRAGHHARILIADGNYPASTKIGPKAQLVCLNLSPGIVTVAQVLRALLSAVPVDAINTMGVPPDDPYAQRGEPPVWKEYRQIIRRARLKLRLESILKWDFYEAVASDDHVLTIQTGDQALWGNVLLTMGCRTKV